MKHLLMNQYNKDGSTRGPITHKDMEQLKPGEYIADWCLTLNRMLYYLIIDNDTEYYVNTINIENGQIRHFKHLAYYRNAFVITMDKAIKNLNKELKWQKHYKKYTQ